MQIKITFKCEVGALATLLLYLKRIGAAKSTLRSRKRVVEWAVDELARRIEESGELLDVPLDTVNSWRVLVDCGIVSPKQRARVSRADYNALTRLVTAEAEKRRSRYGNPE